MLTLRQIEVIRAIMVAGTVNGAAKLLNVSAPGVSRVMKHAEDVLGVRLFSRRYGRFMPTPEVKGIVDQINEVYRKVENLQFSIDSLKRGASSVFSFASVPSISQFVMPRAVKRLRQKYPGLVMNIDILKIEEAIDYLLLKRGDLVAMSYRLDHPGIVSHPLAEGELVAIVSEEHPLAARADVSVAELAEHPIIGVDAKDPYGKIIADAFRNHGTPFELSVKARFAQTTVSLVQQNLGVAVIDEFSVASPTIPGVVRLPIREPTRFRAYAAVNADVPESMFAEDTIRILRDEMQLAVANRSWSRMPRTRAATD
jgi:DNA-binding transcriptional LysR family regulator